MPDGEVHTPHYPTVEFVLEAVAGWINKYRQASSMHDEFGHCSPEDVMQIAKDLGVPVSELQRAVKQDRRDADGCSAKRSHPHQSCGLRLKVGRFGFQRVERLADLADFAARPGGHDLRKAAAPHYHRAGIDKRLIVATRAGAAGRDAGGRNLAHRHRLPPSAANSSA